MACPKATAPPLMLTLDRGMLRTFSAMLTTTEKASLISNKETSSTDKPAFSKALGTARVGAAGKSMGSTPASA